MQHPTYCRSSKKLRAPPFYNQFSPLEPKLALAHGTILITSPQHRQTALQNSTGCQKEFDAWEKLAAKFEIGGKAAYKKKPPSRARTRKRKQCKRIQEIISGMGLAKSGEIGIFYTNSSDIKLQAALVPCTAPVLSPAAFKLLSDRNSIVVTLPA